MSEVNSSEQVASFMRAQEHVRQTNKVYTQAEMDAALDARVEECAVIPEAMRPTGGRMWTDEQHACYAALTDCASRIRALKSSSDEQ